MNIKLSSALLFFCFVIMSLASIASIAIETPVLDMRRHPNGKLIKISGQCPSSEDIIIIISGNVLTYQNAKREKYFGVWMDRKFFTIPYAHSFFTSLSTRHITKITNREFIKKMNIKHKILKESIIEQSYDHADYDDFIDNFHLYERRSVKYPKPSHSIKLHHNGNMTSFDTNIFMHAGVMPGVYKVVLYGFREGELIYRESTSFKIKKTGTGNAIIKIADNKPFLYGLLIILVSTIIGTAPVLAISLKARFSNRQ